MKLVRLQGEYGCGYHPKDETTLYGSENILPSGICPWLYSAIYPYCLGLLYGARFTYNEYGDSDTCCPAASGVDVVVRRRPNDRPIDNGIPETMEFIVFAEIIKIHGFCPAGHSEGDRFIFPSCLKERFLCPAVFHAAFPLSKTEPPQCIDPQRIRCPDTNQPIAFRLDEADPHSGHSPPAYDPKPE